jgi:hypothetical protein
MALDSSEIGEWTQEHCCRKSPHNYDQGGELVTEANCLYNFNIMFTFPKSQIASN